MPRSNLTFNRKRRTPEGLVHDACVPRIKLMGYWWLESHELKKLSPELCVQMVKTRGLKGLAWRSNTGGASDDAGHHVRFGLGGWPDITVAKFIPEIDGFQLIGIELKAGNNTLSPNQGRLHAIFNAFTTRPTFHTVRHHDELAEILK